MDTPTAAQSLSESEKDLVRRVYAELEALMPGFLPRRQQKQMVGQTARTLANGTVALVEAPTGVGKTIGYMVPGIAVAAARNRRLIVSTATAALQDQITLKDMPVLAEAFRRCGFTVRYQAAKGRGRYVCSLRLENLAGQPELFEDASLSEAARDLVGPLASGAWNGERDAWSGGVSDALWRRIQNDRHACLGDRCRMVGRCPYFAVADRAKSAQVVVANHDLVLTGLARTENSLFAEFDTNLYVFDEAHHLPAKTLGAFASQISTDGGWLGELPALLVRAEAGYYRKAAATEVQGYMAAMRAIAATLAAPGSDGDSLIRFRFGRVPAALRSSGPLVAGALGRLLDYVIQGELALAAATELFANGYQGRTRQHLAEMRGGLEEAIEAWRDFTEEDEGRPRARWAERDGSHWRLSTSPFSAGPILRRVLWNSIRGCVLTSATLAPLGSFEATLRDLGLPGDGATETLRLDSPFDYSRAKLIVPRMQHGPENVQGHTDEVRAFVETAIQAADGGVLVLFASARQMADVLATLAPEARESVLAQGTHPVRTILEHHRARVEGGERSAIFGLASFSEGIDLPGRLCTRVIIAKLPFACPDEPLVAAASEWVESQGGRPFFSVLLPAAGIRLAQSVGRLIRSESDWGEVAVLDRRLIEKPYGRQLAAGLPIRPVRT